jgi:hypothetical protein
MELPKVPFFFRIYSHNGQGIIYKALREVGHETYDCQGTRQGGVVDDKIVWVMAEYTDVMPAASIASVIDLEKVGKRETTALIRDNHLDPALGKMPLYEAGAGYLFGSGRAASRSKSRSASPKSKSKSKSKKNRA